MLKIFAPGVAGGQAHPTDFNSPFVQELISLIQDGTLDARIDLEKGVLVSKQTDLRTDVQRAALESLVNFRKEAHLRLLRTNILRAGLEVRAPGDERKLRPEDRGVGKGLAGLGGKYSR
jgi:COP9 signalosome complex subunit 1